MCSCQTLAGHPVLLFYISKILILGIKAVETEVMQEDWNVWRRRDVPKDLAIFSYHWIFRGKQVLETSRRDANKSGIPGE